MTWEATGGQLGDENAVLTAFSGAQAAEACLAYPKDQRDARYREKIEPLYPGFGENFVRSRFMDWPRDEWAQGSYSFPAPGFLTKYAPVLAAGAGRLHFAGEHMGFKFVGFMEGALQAGVGVARRIAVRDDVGAPRKSAGSSGNGG
jgi:monoamine oxidase